MLRFQYEVGFEKSFHYSDFQVFHNIQGFIMFRLCFLILIGTQIFGFSSRFKVKCCVSQLFLMLVLSAGMNVLILNWKLHMNKQQTQV